MYSQYWDQELEKAARTSAPLFWITGERVSGGALEKKKKQGLYGVKIRAFTKKRDASGCLSGMGYLGVSLGNGVPR